MQETEDFDEENAIGNYWTDTIYPSNFKNMTGKFLNIVTEEDGNTTVEYHPPYPSRNRIKLTATFIKSSGDIKEVTLRKFKQYTKNGVQRWEEQRWGPGEPMTFTHLTFEKLLAFLKLLTELDLANLNQRRFALRDHGELTIDEETQEKMRALLRQPDGIAIIDELLRSGSITSRDLVNIGYRKKQLAVFERLLRDPDAISKYREKHGIKNEQAEKVWQHFFQRNEWIFGFGLDYRFLGILQREAHIGLEDTAGRDGAIVDFLLGAENFTVLVELKTPETPLFQNTKNRANSWQLSNELVQAVSQILEQKASWLVKAETRATSNFDSEGNLIRQSTIDPKCILIIGSNSAYFAETDKEKAIKLRTFELFRRDSRNIEIVTYDELFARAQFIVEHGSRRGPPIDAPRSQS